VDAIRSDIGATVNVIDVTSDPIIAASIEDALEILQTMDHQVAVVIPDEEGSYRIQPTND
jgi:hypothetical protein